MFIIHLQNSPASQVSSRDLSQNISIKKCTENQTSLLSIPVELSSLCNIKKAGFTPQHKDYLLNAFHWWKKNIQI